MHKDHIVVSQEPLAVGKFWRLVYETQCKCVMQVGGGEWLVPQEEREEVIVKEELVVKVTEKKVQESYERRGVRVKGVRCPGEEGVTVWYYQCTEAHRTALLQMLADMDATTSFPKPLLIYSPNTPPIEGLLCACVCLWMSVREKRSVDVFHLVRRLKDRCSTFVNSSV